MLFSESQPQFLARKKSQIGNEMFGASKKLGRLIKDFDLIQSNDRLLLIIDGFAESFCLLDLLVYRQSFSPVKYGLKVVLLENCIPPVLRVFIEDFCKSYHVDYSVSSKTECNLTDAVEILQNTQSNKWARSLTFDDFNEILLEQMFFHGSLNFAGIKENLSVKGLSQISPLGYVKRDLIREMVLKEYPEVTELFHPHVLTEKRQAIRHLLNSFRESYAIEKNIFNSYKKIKTEYLL